jgi:hypothetical protein
MRMGTIRPRLRSQQPTGIEKVLGTSGPASSRSLTLVPSLPDLGFHQATAVRPLTPFVLVQIHAGGDTLKPGAGSKRRDRAGESMTMPEVDKDQLEALRNRVDEEFRSVEEDFRRAEENYRRAEENYRLDIAAIEHLHSRFFGGLTSISTSETSSGNGLYSKPPAAIPPPKPVSAAKVNEEWEIFKSVHK